MKSVRERGIYWFSRIYGWLTERLYNELAWIYDPVSWLVSLGAWDTIRKESLDYLFGQRVLEIGFGTGELLLELNRRQYPVFGLDSSQAMHRVVTRKSRRLNVSIPRVHAYSQQIPFSDNTFDTVIATFPAGYIFNPQTWKEASRVLRKTSDVNSGKGGFIIVGICATAVGTPRLPLAVFSFGIPMDELLFKCQQLAAQANLSFQVDQSTYKGLEFPIIIAQKRDG